MRQRRPAAIGLRSVQKLLSMALVGLALWVLAAACGGGGAIMPPEPEIRLALRGIVLDQNDYPVPRAGVTCSPPGITVKTDADGFFEFTELPQGDYSLTVSKIGFDPYAADLELTVESDLDIGILINRHVEDNSPYVSIISPVSGQTVSGRVEVLFQVYDDNEVAQVQIALDQGVIRADVALACPGGMTCNHSYSLDLSEIADGAHSLSVTVTDDSGLASAATAQVTVENAQESPPNSTPSVTVAATPSFGYAPLAVDFSIQCVDSDGQCQSYYWEFGDGGNAAIAEPSHTFNSSGTYWVMAIVTDDAGGVGADSVTVVVLDRDPDNQPPQVDVHASSAQGAAPLEVEFSAGCSDADGSCMIFQWDFGDGQSSLDENPTHTFSEHGTYLITLIAEDDYGDVAVDAVKIFVFYEEPMANEWITIPEGEFIMGCSENAEQCVEAADPVNKYLIDTPRHTVNVPEFQLQKYEVTVYDYGLCVEAGVCTRVSINAMEYDYTGDMMNNPMSNLRWYYANDYCQWIGARLPTEAEWEKAARGPSPSQALYPWGDDDPDCSLAVYFECAASSSQRIGSHPDNVSYYGVFDMAGNVTEWIEDDYHTDYVGAPTDGSAWYNPFELGGKVVKINRGGSWNYPADKMLNSTRTYNGAGYGYGLFGVRCARD